MIVRLLGGRGYWPYGVDQLAAFAREREIRLALLPGDDQPDAELAALSTIPAEVLHRLWQYFVHGGVDNAVNALRYAASLIGFAPRTPWQEPAPLLRAGLYWPGIPRPSISDLEKIWRAEAPRAAVLFYRALVQAADTAPIDALIAELRSRGLNPVPIYCTSLKDSLAAAVVLELIKETNPEIILSATGFAQNNLEQAPGTADKSPLGADCPVIQIVLAGGTEAEWRAGTRGLSARDIAMNIALPEVDGRIIGRAVSFKDRLRRDDLSECDIVAHRPVPDRIAFVADLAASWVRLRRTPEKDRRVGTGAGKLPQSRRANWQWCRLGYTEIRDRRSRSAGEQRFRHSGYSRRRRCAGAPVDRGADQ